MGWRVKQVWAQLVERQARRPRDRWHAGGRNARVLPLLHSEPGDADRPGQRSAAACLFDGGGDPADRSPLGLVWGPLMLHVGNGREILNSFQAAGCGSPQQPNEDICGSLPRMDDARHKQLVGSRLRIAREALGLEQKELAAQIGIDNTKLSHWERGVHYPAPTFIVRLWERHRIPADWIYLGEVSGVPHRLAGNLLAAAAGLTEPKEEPPAPAAETDADA